MTDLARTDLQSIDLRSICDTRIFDKSYMISLGVNKDLRPRIIDATSFLPTNTPLKIRALTINLGYTAETFPRCSCGSYVTWEKEYQRSLSQYCSAACSRGSRRRLSSQAYQCLSSYEWLYAARIEGARSIEDIAKELGCSITPVVKACKTLGIPQVRYNESSPLALARLRNKDWLYEEHVVKKRKLRDIAEEIGSWSGTVSVWLAKHGIVANAPNSYDRAEFRSSKEQQEVVDFIRSLLPDTEIIVGNRSVLNGRELDILIPSKKLAIEYNGIYSHLYRPWENTEAGRKDRNYYLYKSLGCQSQGIDLIHIFSDDWILRKDIWKSILRSRLGVGLRRVGARKCVLGIPGKNEKNQFLRDNHLQGADKSTNWCGLYLDEELVALMTFGRSRYNKQYEWELVRFCVRQGFSVPGAFSRLLKELRGRCPGSVVSYADFSRSNGEVYRANGFELVRQNPPSYAYVNLSEGIQRLHRAQFMKGRLGGEGTEYEQMRQLGYEKIWDCGTLTFALPSPHPVGASVPTLEHVPQ